MPPSPAASDGTSLVTEAVLSIDPDLLRHSFLLAGQPGYYYVRIFRKSAEAQPVIVLADTGNIPEASVVNQIDVVAWVTARTLLDQPDTTMEQLGSVGRWITISPPIGSIGAVTNEVLFDGGRPRPRYLSSHAEIEDVVGDTVRPLAPGDFAVESLDARGVRVARVGRA
ncbi:hypothetical protein [Cryptosporangium minutisporangium]|uniref:Uncharacterized protein n=1 Tax=Cryptosporangium minutisporangium TaxID=113569 RepID=A0ABP6SYH8_9ACTN